MRRKLINFEKEFTSTPGGRFIKLGPYSGELFRDTVLKPALTDFEEVELDLNGVFSFPPSFLDEAFGVIVEQFGYETVKRKLKIIVTDDPLLPRKIEAVMVEHRDKTARC
jgi:hypothetical protein